MSRSKLQLVGVTSMLIASKYEEMYAPEIADFVYITDNAYSKADIRRMECLILKTLDFNLGRPLPLHFLRRNSKAGEVSTLLTMSVLTKSAVSCSLSLLPHFLEFCLFIECFEYMSACLGYWKGTACVAMLLFGFRFNYRHYIVSCLFHRGVAFSSKEVVDQ